MVRLLRADRPRARSYFSRREQWRLLTLIAAAGLVIIAIRQIKRPETVARLTHVFAAEGVNAESNPVKIGRRAQAESAPPRTVRSVRQHLSAEALATIRDDTYFRAAEKSAWFELISILQSTPASEIAAESVGDVGYVQLARQPNSYRAKVVTVRGTARRVTKETPADNDLGLPSYYRLVVHPAGGEVWPIFVYALELPPGIPLGETVAVDVSATGVFFKNLSYNWHDGVEVAPVVLAKSVMKIETSAETSAPVAAAESRLPIAADEWRVEDAAVARPGPLNFPAELTQILSLAGWNAERWEKFSDGEPLSPENRRELVSLLWRVRTFDAASVAAWTRNDVSVAAIAAGPAEYRGQFVRISGRATKLRTVQLPSAEATRFEMPRYFECEVALQDNAGTATVLTTRVPHSWLSKNESVALDEPATVAGLFVQLLPTTDGRPHILLVAKQVAADTIGRTVLATLGMDVGLLDGVRSQYAANEYGIFSGERDAFYEILAAVGQLGANQMVRIAQQNLGLVAKAWEADLRSPDRSRQALAQEVVRRANEGQYSIAPLFNDPDRQVGQLVLVDGMARRIVRIDAHEPADGDPVDDIARRLGIDQYYEMEVFTEDSPNYPLVFCVRELPAGMPTGGDLREPVRVAGFFFKKWKFRSRNTGQGDDRIDAAGESMSVPLLIGRSPLRIETAPADGYGAELVGSGLFLLALLGIWAAAWWIARGDQRFRRQTAAASFSLPAGESLDELNVPLVGEPMNITGSPASHTLKASELQ